jgi:hypothetical protein
METIFWGPDGWKFLHTLTFLYPENPSFEDKSRMVEFMKLLCFILPCKYCRSSFTKYSKSLPINKYLDSRKNVIEWLYHMHNKVNGKLKRQGFCHSENPSIEKVYTKYNPIIKHINMLINKAESSQDATRSVVNYICDLGLDFLGSIIFNYQSYFSNCHTTEEKTKIVNVYHSFFNMITPMIAGFIDKSAARRCVGLRVILLRNEAYSKLQKWFYNQKELIDLDSKFSCYEKYFDYFNKHIVASCNSPTADKVKSCRKTVSYRKTTKKSSNKI